MTEKYDWSQFQVHSYVNKSVKEVFKMWSTCQGLESFFIKNSEFTTSSNEKRIKSEYAQKGDSYSWQFMHDFKLSGKILDINENDFIIFTFGGMEVKVEISSRDNQTLIKLHQYKIPYQSEPEKASNHLNCRSCWVFFLTNLKSVMENNKDLRETDPNKSDCVSVYFKP